MFYPPFRCDISLGMALPFSIWREEIKAELAQAQQEITAATVAIHAAELAYDAVKAQHEAMRNAILLSILFLAAASVSAQTIPTIDPEHLAPSAVPTGKAMFHQFCAPCHGLDAKGHGPNAPTLKTY